MRGFRHDKFGVKNGYLISKSRQKVHNLRIASKSYIYKLNFNKHHFFKGYLMEILHDICHNIYLTLMEQKFILTVLALLLAQVGSLSLSRHDGYSNTCFYYFGSLHSQ